MSQISGASPFQLPSAEVDKMLARGENAELLRAYFGDAEYAELSDLARRASTRVRRRGPKVLILPGILGSTLGIREGRRTDTIWFDPISIVAGDASKLALSSNANIVALDVIPLLYTKLKWRLWWYGFDADFYCYDWRQSVDTLGEQLKRYCDKQGPVQLVAHSLGGLVARAAVAAGARTIQRVVMLGTPNAGSFAPVQVFRASASTVRQVAALDLQHSTEQLVKNVFGTFPSLYQMLPFADHFRQLDLYSQGTWPKAPSRPKRGLLKKAVEVQRSLADPALSVFHMIAGANQSTIGGIRRTEQDGKARFTYLSHTRGDGTVPLDLAALPGMQNYYVAETHNGLTGNSEVAQAVRDLLKSGETDVLSREPPVTRDSVREVSESELLGESVFDGRVGHGVTEAETREIVKSLFSPLSNAAAPAAPTGPTEATEPPGFTSLATTPAVSKFDGIVVGRRRAHRLDLELVNGSITDVDARAAVLGVFENVKPSGPAKAFNQLLDNAIDDLVARRMFKAGLGDVFMLPTGTHPVRAETVLFAGLGPFDAFTGHAQQIVASNVLRTLVRAGVDEFATVLFGGNSTERSSDTLENLVRGFLAALLETDTRHRFRRIILCELNAERFQAMKHRLYELAGTPLFDEVELTIDERAPLASPTAPAPVVQPREAASTWPPGEPLYLTVRWLSLEDEDDDDNNDNTDDGNNNNNEQVALRASLLTVGHKATVFSTLRQFRMAELKELLDRIPRLRASGVAELGRALAEMVLDANMLDLLGRDEFKDSHLILAHDADSSRIPWELLNIGDADSPRYPALESGITRKYMADNMSIAKWLERRRLKSTLDVLLIVNPTQDLDGAEEEGQKVHAALSVLPTVRVTPRLGPRANRETLLNDFRSGKYDIVHYAGHAYFNRRQPALSGIKCAGGDILSGADLRDVGELPSLVFFNACESARIRGGQQDTAAPDQQGRDSAGFAEAFLRGGVANFIGTYWNVGDAAALRIATGFYSRIIDGDPIGKALLEARRDVESGTRSKDWADYMSYGDPGFVLKLRPR